MMKHPFVIKKCIWLTLACFVTCTVCSCSGSEEKETPNGWWVDEPRDQINVTYEKDKEMKWRMPHDHQDYLGLYNEMGDRVAMYSQYISYTMSEPIPADKCYEGNIPRYAKYVVFPFMCCDGADLSGIYDDYRNYVMVFTNNHQSRETHYEKGDYYFNIDTNYMYGHVEEDKDTDADLKATMHYLTLEMNFPIHFTGKSETKYLNAVEVSTVKKSEVFTLRKHVFDAEDEVPLMGSGITLFISDGQDTEDDFECRINMLPFDLQGDQLQVKVYVMEDNQSYVSTIPINDWGSSFKAGESYTMAINYQDLSRKLATSMIYTGSYVLSEDEVTLEKWTGLYPVVNMESDEQLNKVKCIATKAFYYNYAIRQLTLPSGLVEIGEKAFYACRGLQAIEIPSGVQIIPKQCFDECGGLKVCVLHEGVTEIDDYAFRYCSLKSLELPSTLKRIGREAIRLDESSHVICRATVPPVAVSHLGYPRKVYVPAESVDAYKAAAHWNSCTILSLEELDD